MRKHFKCLRFCAGCAVILLSLMGYALSLSAQTPVGVPPVKANTNSQSLMPSVGIEFGYGQHSQHGSYICDCGAVFTGGNGNGVLGSAFFELPLGRMFAVGLKAGLDFKSTSSTSTLNEFDIIKSGDSNQILNMPMNRTGVLKITLLRFTPYFQYQVLGSSFFVQLGPGISDILSNNLTQTRSLISNSVTLPDGATLNNVTFTNGTSSEIIQEGSFTNLHSVLFSGVISAGYGFDLGQLVISPIATYDIPLSNIQTNSNLKISSIYGLMQVKLKI